MSDLDVMAKDLPEGNEAGGARRREYRPPRLEALGDVRDVTLGITPGLGDSTPINQRNF